MAALKVMLVDDEPLALSRLRRLLAERDDAELCGEAKNGSRALDLIRETRPEVVLLDVEMPGDSGVSVAEAINRMGDPPVIIFVTAYENYAVEAFGVRALDYLVKPVRPERLGEALARAREARPVTGRRALNARVGDRTLRIPLDEVRMLKATDKYTQVVHLSGVHLVDDSLASLEKEFSERFVRIHRATLVSRAHIVELFRDAAGVERLRLAGCEPAPKVSRRNLSYVRRLLRR